MNTTRTPSEDAPTGELMTAAVGDRCTNCNAPLASDQRYCVNCGERRGKARFSFSELTSAPAHTPPPPPRRPRAWGSGALVAGVGTLILAMGVGVLIGRTGNNAPQRVSAPGVQVVKIDGGGAGSSAAASSPAAREARKTAAALKTPSITLSKKTATAATAAAAKVLGSGAKNLPPPTVKLGQPGHGAGYQKGHFTGNFFGN